MILGHKTMPRQVVVTQTSILTVFSFVQEEKRKRKHFGQYSTALFHVLVLQIKLFQYYVLCPAQMLYFQFYFLQYYNLNQELIRISRGSEWEGDRGGELTRGFHHPNNGGWGRFCAGCVWSINAFAWPFGDNEMNFGYVASFNLIIFFLKLLLTSVNFPFKINHHIVNSINYILITKPLVIH